MIKDERYMRFFPRLMKYEGGYVNDPADSGGETKYGISKRAYPQLDIKNLTEADAMEIFYRDYYLPLNIPDIDDEKTAWQLFDFGVNAGVKRSARMIQKIVGSYPDGVIGRKTLGKINTFQDDYSLHNHFLMERLRYYLDLGERNQVYRKFLKGWVLRAIEL